MANNDFTIRLQTEVVKGDSESQLGSIIKELEKDVSDIKIGLDTSSLKEDIKELKSELEQLKKLQKDTVTPPKKDSALKKESDEAKELIAEYKRLFKEKEKIEKKLPKLSIDGQSYKTLKKELKDVVRELDDVGKKIDATNKKKIKSDMTKSLALAFESVIKQANALGTSMDNALKNKDFGGKYLSDLKRLKTTLQTYTKDLDLSKIINSDKSYEEMAKVISKIDTFSDKFSKLSIDNSFSKRIEKTHSDIDTLKRKVTDLYTSGYGDTKVLDSLIKKLDGLKSRKIDVDSKDASNKFKNLQKDLANVRIEISKTESQMSRMSKIDTFKFSVEGTLRNLKKVKDQCKEDADALMKLNDLEQRLEKIRNVPSGQTKDLAQAKKTYKSLQNELKSISAEVGEVDKIVASMENLNKLLSQRANLKRQKSTTVDDRAAIELETKLQRNLDKIWEIDDSIDKVRIEKLTDAMIDNRLINSFDALQKKITSTGLELKNAFQNKNLTSDQISELEKLKVELGHLKGVSLSNILQSNSPNDGIRRLITDFDTIKNKIKEINIDNTFTNKIEALERSTDNLEIKMLTLKEAGFVDPGNIQILEDMLDKIQKLTNGIHTSADAAQDLREATSMINVFNDAYNSLMGMSKLESRSFGISTEITKYLKDMHDLKAYYDSLTSDMQTNILRINPDFAFLDKIKDEIIDLKNLPIGEAEAKLKSYGDTISRLKGASNKFKEDSEALKEFNRLLSERDKIELKMGATPVGTTQYAVLESKLQDINNELFSMMAKMNSLSDEDMNIQLFQGYIQLLEKSGDKIESLNKKILEAFSNKDLTTNQETRLNDLINDIIRAEGLIGGGFTELETAIATGQRPTALHNDLADIQDLVKKIAGEFESLGKSVQIKTNFESTLGDFNKLFTSVERFEQLGAFRNNADFATLLAEIQRLINLPPIDFDSDTAEKDLQDLQEELKKCTEEFDRLKAESGMGLKVDKLDTDMRNLERDLTTTRDKIIQLGQSTASVDALITALHNLNGISIAEAQSEISKIRKELSYIDQDVNKQLKKSTKTSISSDIYSSLAAYSLGDIIGDQISKGISSATSTITELDSAFRDLQKVAPASFRGTTEELKALRDEAYRTGQEVARESVDIINSTASALQLGITNIKDAMQYAKQVNMYANVADLSEEDADKYVKSIASAYGGVAESLKPMRNQVKGAAQDYSMLTDYMDQANYAGNNYAVTSADVGEALMRSASQLKANGNSMSQSIAMVVGANETVQDASRVGNAMKSLAVNLNGVSFSAKEGKVTLNKTAKALKSIAGIDVMKNQNGEIKTGFEVLDELSKKWNDLNDVQQAAIAEALGQKYHANTLIAMLDNWDTVLQYQNEYNEGFTVGSMATENERYINSIEGKVVNLKEQFKSLLTTVVTTDMTKTGIDVVAGAVEKLNGGLKELDSVGMATPVAISSLITLFNIIKDNAEGEGYSNIFTDLIPELRAMDEETRNNILTNARASGSLRDLGRAYWQVYGRNTLVQLGAGLLNTALLSLVGAGINAAIKAWDDYKNKSKHAREEMEQMRDATKEEITTLSGSLSSVKKMAKRYDELSKKIDRTAEETEELSEYQQQLAEQFPELVIDYDSNGNPLLDLTDGLDGVIERLERALKEQKELLRYQNASLALEAGREVEEQGYRQTDKVRRQMYTGKTENKHGTVDTSKTLESGLGGIVLKNADDFATASKKYRETITEYEKTRTNLMATVAENYSAYAQAEATQQKAALDEFLTGKTYSEYTKLGDAQKSTIQSLMNSFDWSNELVANNLGKRNEFLSSGFNQLSKYASINSDEVKKWAKEIDAINQAYQQTGNIEKYKEQLKTVAKAMEGVTGISADEWVTGFTQQFAGAAKQESIMLEGFLSGFDFSLSDLILNKEGTERLRSQFNQVRDMINGLTSINDKDQQIKFILDIVQGNTFQNLPPQLSAILSGLVDDRETLSDTSMSLALTLSTYIQQNGQLTDEEVTFFQKLINGEIDSESKELELGFKLSDGTVIGKDILKLIAGENEGQSVDYKVNLDVDENQKTRLENINKELAKFKKISEREEIQKLFTNETLNIKSAEYIEKIMDKLPTGKELTIDFVTENADALNSLRSYKEVVEWLLNNPSIASKYEIQLIGEKSIDNVMTKLQTLFQTNEEKEVSKKIGVALKAGDLEGLKAAINEIENEEKRVKVAAELSEELKALQSEEANVLAEKLVKIYAVDENQVIEKMNEVDEKAKNPAVKKTEFEEEGYKEVKEKIDTIDETESPVVKEVEIKPKGDKNTGDKLDEVDKSAENKDKTVTVDTKGAEETKQDLQEVDESSKNGNKNVNTNTSGVEETKGDLQEVDDASVERTKIVENVAMNVRETLADLQKIDANAGISPTKTVWVALKETAKGVLNFLFGGKTTRTPGDTGGKYNDGTTGFTDISDSPMQMMSASQDVSMASEEGDVSASGAFDYGDYGSSSAQSAPLLFRTLETQIELNFDKMIYAIKNSIKYFQELENRISKVTNEISSLGTELDRAVGTERIDLLQRQNALYEEQIRLQKQYHTYLGKEKEALQNSLKALGFTFNAEDNLTSYEEKLVAMQKQLDAYNDAYEKAQKNESNYKGGSTSKQKTLSKATENAQKKRDDYQEKLEEAKTLTDAYLSLQFTEIPQLEEEWKSLTNSIKDNNDEIDRLKLEDRLYQANNMITELTTNYDKLDERMSLLDAKIERVHGGASLPYYAKQNELLHEQLDLVNQNIKQQNRLAKEYRDVLSDRYGFEFTSSGDLINIDEVLNKYQNSDKLEVLKETMEEYIEIQNSSIPSLETQWEELGKRIEEVNVEIERVELETSLYRHKNAIKSLEQEYARLENIISLNSVKLESLNDNNKINIYNVQIDSMKKQRKVLEKEIEEYKAQINAYKTDLEKYGFEFDEVGEVLNMDKVLNKYQNSSSLENITELLEEYLDLQSNELPNAVKGWEELGNSIQDIHNDKLSVVQNIEDKITSIYEDEIEKRKDKIEEEKDALVKSLQEQKEAYQKYRDEVEYKNEMEEQLDKIAKLNSKIAILEKDTSLSSRAKIESLKEELEEENKTLEKMRQDQLDKKIEEMYDNQIDAAEKDAEDKTKQLEDEWSLEKISEYVKNAIDTGYFENIDGQVVSLKEKMIEFAEESGDALGIMGDVIKNELVGNLDTARSILDEYPKIFNELGLKQYGEDYKDSINKSNGNINMSSVNVDSINISVVSDNPKDVSKEIAKSIETELGYIANNL